MSSSVSPSAGSNMTLFQTLCASLSKDDLGVLSKTKKEGLLKTICDKVVKISLDKLPPNWTKLDRLARNIVAQDMKTAVFLSNEITPLTHKMFEEAQERDQDTLDKIAGCLEYEYVQYLKGYIPEQE